MKKKMAMMLALAMMMTLCACGQSSESGNVSQSTAGQSSPSASQEEVKNTKSYHLKISTTSNDTENHTIGMKMFAEKVAELTDGQVTAEVFSSGTLYSKDETIPEMLAGNLEMGTTEAAFMTDYMPSLEVLTCPYIYQNYEHWNAVMGGEIGSELFDQIAAETGIRPICAFYVGARHITLTEDKEVTCRADLDGVLLRVANSESWIQMGNALGASPVPMSLSEVYMALSTGTLDGQENPLPTTYQQGFGEVIKSITLSQHVVGNSWLAISEAVWQDMGEELQAKVMEAANYATEWVNAENLNAEAELVQTFRDMGVQVYEPDVSVFKDEVLSYYLDDPAVSGDWDMDLYDKVQSANPN